MATEAPVRSREARANVKQMVAIGAIVSVLGIALGLLIDWFPVQASGEAKHIDTLWDVLLIASVPVFVLVQTIVLYSVWKFRMRPGEELIDGPPIHGNTRLEVWWTAIPAALLVGLCSYAYVVLHDIEKAAADATMNVRVVGEQFTWTFHYPGESGGKELVTQPALPAGRHRGEVHGPVQGRDPRLLRAGLPREDRRRAGDRHDLQRRDDAGRQLPRGLRGAVRARALHDAPDCARAAQGRLRVVAERAAVEGGGMMDRNTEVKDMDR